MKYFLRAIKLSLRYKWAIVGAILCSLMVALLWSASITTVYPVVQSVFEKKPLVQLLDDKIDKVREDLATKSQAVADIQNQLRDAEPTEEVKLRRQLAASERYVSGDQETIDWLLQVRPFVDKYAPKKPFGTLLATMSLLLVATALKGVFLVLSSILVARIAHGTVRDMRRIYYRKALDLDQIRIDRLGTSNMMTHLSHNMLMISGGLTMFYGKTIREPLKMITCLAIAAWISWPLLLVSLFVVPMGAWIIHSIAKRMKNATQREVQGMADVFDTLIETFGAIKTVRIFNRERAERRRFKDNAATLYRMSLRIRYYDSLLRPIMELLGIMSIAAAVLAGAYLTLNDSRSIFFFDMSNHGLEPAELMLFYAMLAGASDPARKMGEILNVLVRGGTACEKLFQTYEVDAKVCAPANPTPIPLHSKQIAFKDVVFGYLPRQPVLKKINLVIPYRETLAIVGENGCGKSTLVNLLARFYDPHQGTVSVDGVDLRQTNPKKLRRQIAWVTQDSMLFRGTVWENIAYGLRNPTEAEVQQAAQLAQVDTFLDDLPSGYHSDVGESGRQLSAGQRQRVMLARAILADPRILVLDEATSQMDGHTEQLVRESLAGFIKSRTTIIITHRLSSIKLASRVIVMHQGRVVSDSTPEDAVSSSEQFQVLFSKSA